MTITQATLSFLTEIIALASVLVVIVSRFKELEHRIAVNRFHLESHCQQLTHISSHLQATSGYQPITKHLID